MLWWGPNILTKELRQAFDFEESLTIDTGFQSLAVFRKKIDHIDYDFFETNLALVFLQFYFRKYKTELSKVLKKLSPATNN